jgi:hypothetical protein
MSALAQDRSPGPGRRRPLSAVPKPPAILGRTPFLLILASVLVLVLGMVGVLLLNTTLQSRAFDVRRLQRQANELAYLRADLDSKARLLATTEELARRAKDLGRPIRITWSSRPARFRGNLSRSRRRTACWRTSRRPRPTPHARRRCRPPRLRPLSNRPSPATASPPCRRPGERPAPSGPAARRLLPHPRGSHGRVAPRGKDR